MPRPTTARWAAAVAMLCALLATGCDPAKKPPKPQTDAASASR